MNPAEPVLAVDSRVLVTLASPALSSNKGANCDANSEDTYDMGCELGYNRRRDEYKSAIFRRNTRFYHKNTCNTPIHGRARA
jgi:hypothetical protein